VLLAGLACAGTAVWDGGGADANWRTANNWNPNGTPTFANDLDVIFYSSGAAGLLTNFIGGAGAITIRSLSYAADADGDVVTRLTSNLTGTTGRSVQFGGAGGAAINSDADAAGNFTVGVANGNLVLLESLTINHNGSGVLQFSRPITGAFAVTNAGTGYLWLSGANTFSGGLTHNGGTLKLGNNAAFGTGPVTINGGSLDTGATRTTSNHNPQFWGGDFTFIGTDTLDLGTGVVTLAASRQVTVSASTMTVGGPVVDGGAGYGLTKRGAGVLSLEATNTYSGATSVEEGTLQFLGNNTLGGGTLTIGNAKLVSLASLSLTNNVNVTGRAEFGTGSGAIDLLGIVSGPGSLYKNGANQLVLRSANTFSGGVTNNAGTLSVKNASALGTGPLVVQGSGTMYWDGVFDAANGGLGITNDIVLSSVRNFNTLGSGNRILLSGTISGPGGISRNCFGGSTLILTGDNTFESGMLLQVGRLFLGHVNALGTGPITNRNSDADDYIGVVADLSGGAGVPNDFVLMSNLVVNVTNNLQLSGDISKSSVAAISPMLIKRGGALLILSGANSYDGGTKVEQGTLRLAADDALPPGGELTLAGGALDMGAYTNAPSTLSVTANSTLALGSGRLSFVSQTGAAWGGRLALAGELGRYTLRFVPALTPAQLSSIDYLGGNRFYQSSDGYLRTYPRGTILSVL
jgi:autotransporter-associated beta strand protein